MCCLFSQALFYLLASFSAGLECRSKRCVGGCRDEQLWLQGPCDAAEHWHSTPLSYVKEERHAGGKDTMCWPGWQEVRLTGQDNKRLLGAEVISKYELKSSHVSSLSEVLTHIALMAVPRALAFWKGLTGNSLAKMWLTGRAWESKMSPWKEYGPLNIQDKFRNHWQNYPVSKDTGI